jgi:hypothetical protein
VAETERTEDNEVEIENAQRTTTASIGNAVQFHDLEIEVLQNKKQLNQHQEASDFCVIELLKLELSL